MSLSSDTLATELEGMLPADSEPEGIDNFAAAFEAYFSESQVGGFSVVPGSLAAPTAALKRAMSGVSKTGGASMAAGITAFWGVVASAAATIWPTLPFPLASATPPPNLANLAAAITAAGVANIAAGLSLEDAAAAMAAAIHPNNLGGIAINTAPTPVSIPIL